jgi:hypothetical protein
MIKCEVISKTEAEDGDILVIGFPDKTGQVVTLTNVGDEDLEALKKGGLYTLAFVPFVNADNPVSNNEASENAPTDETPVPTDHALVMEPTEASQNDKADVSDVLVAPITANPTAPAVASVAPQASPATTDSTASQSSTAGEVDPTANTGTGSGDAASS